jgi:hypothetical protein
MPEIILVTPLITHAIVDHLEVLIRHVKVAILLSVEVRHYYHAVFAVRRIAYDVIG